MAFNDGSGSNGIPGGQSDPLRPVLASAAQPNFNSFYAYSASLGATLTPVESAQGSRSATGVPRSFIASRLKQQQQSGNPPVGNFQQNLRPQGSTSDLTNSRSDADVYDSIAFERSSADSPASHRSSASSAISSHSMNGVDLQTQSVATVGINSDTSPTGFSVAGGNVALPTSLDQYQQPSLWDDEYREGVSDDEEDEVVGLLASKRRLEMQGPLDLEQQRQSAQIKSRITQEQLHGMQKIRSQLSQAANVFRELALLVHEQQENLDLIETSTLTAKSDTGSAIDELKKAHTLKQKKRRRNMMLMLIAAAVALVFILTFWTPSSGPAFSSASVVPLSAAPASRGFIDEKRSAIPVKTVYDPKDGESPLYPAWED